MYCIKCGNQISDDAKFCGICGAAQPSNVTNSGSNKPQPSQPVYEYCEIVFEKKMGLLFMQGRLWAKATGPKGVYTAAAEEKWHNGLPQDPGARKGYQEACDRMLMQLQNDGWEIIPNPRSVYYNYQFRRLIK